jgi:hypothetical protein
VDRARNVLCIRMANLRRFDLVLEPETSAWLLRDSEGRIHRRYADKEDVVAGDVLGKALGSEGGSVRIHLFNGEFEEERTYHPSSDPRLSGC